MKQNKFDMECAAFFNALYVDEHKVLVFGEGKHGARVMMIGEAPGEQESLKGRPFVGKAGKNLDAFIEMTGLMREDMYITNTVKFRPVKRSSGGRVVNRAPTREEIELMLPWLKREIAQVKPEVIVTLGNVPLRALMGRSATIGALHGSWMQYEGMPLYALYHPAAVIYNRAIRDVYEADVRALAEWLARG